MNLIVTNSSSATDEPELSTWADLSLLGVAFIWGLNLPIMKGGLEQMDEYAFNAIRLAISSLVLIVFAGRERSAGFFALPARMRVSVVAYACIASGLYQLLFLLGIYRTTAGNASLIMSTVPMWTALLALLFLNERLSRQAWMGLLIALCGTLIVTAQNGISGDQQYFTGNVIMLFGALAWAAGTVISRPLLPYLSPLRLSAFSSTVMLPMHFLVAGSAVTASFSELSDVRIWWPLLYSGVLSTGLALPMWSFGVREAGAAHAAVFQNLIPVIAIVSAFLIRNESVTPVQVVGGTLIISGLIVMRRARRIIEQPKQTSTEVNPAPQAVHLCKSSSE